MSGKKMIGMTLRLRDPMLIAKLEAEAERLDRTPNSLALYLIKKMLKEESK